MTERYHLSVRIRMQQSSRVASMLDSDDPSEMSPVYEEVFGSQFALRCDGFETRLQANVADEGSGERLDNVSTSVSGQEVDVSV